MAGLLYRLHPGMLIRTNYSGPYRIRWIERGCTCPSPEDELEMIDPPPLPEHVHLVLTDPAGRGEYFLGYYVEATLKSVISGDWIEIMEQDKPVQMEMF